MTDMRHVDGIQGFDSHVHGGFFRCVQVHFDRVAGAESYTNPSPGDR